MGKTHLILGLGCALLAGASTVVAQEDGGRASVSALDEEQIRKIVEEAVRDEYAKGIVTIGGAELKLGGKIELNFVDTQNESASLPGGPTDNPDPHLIFDRLRIEPELDIGRGLEFYGQIDFLADEGDTFIKEAVLHHRYEKTWFRLDSKVGIEDRFIHIGPNARVTESFPLLGTAFWRDEELALLFAARFGRKGGPKPSKDVEKEYAELMRYTDSALWHSPPLDFSSNPGAFTLHFSLGGGSELDGKSVIKDKADLQEIIQDNRKVENTALRDVGVGLEYERDFLELGEISILGFYYEDKLDDDSVRFLQQNLTIFDPLTNQPLAGYGLREESFKRRIGITFRYHLEAFHLLYERGIDTQPGDGVYLTAQYIDAKDGKLERDGFYVQGSYRYSFQKPLIGDRYFRYIEPVIRYGELNSNATSFVNLPWSWDREELVFGAVAGLTKKILLKMEYVISDEDTGGSDVDNNEFLFQVLVNF